MNLASTFFHTGDLGCGDVDIEAFKASCRAPLFPNRWNTWSLFRTTTDNPSRTELEEKSRAVLDLWFGGIFGRPFQDLATNVELVTFDDPGDGKEPFGRNVDPVARKEDCTQFMYLRPGPYVRVGVRFAYRGTATNMPWPVHRNQLMNSWCPIDCDWMLDRVFPPEDEVIPEPPSTFPNLPGFGTDPQQERWKKFIRRGLIGAGIALTALLFANAYFGAKYGSRAIKELI